MLEFEWYTSGTNRGEDVHHVTVLDYDAEVFKGIDGYGFKITHVGGSLGIPTLSKAKRLVEEALANQYEKRKEKFIKDSNEFLPRFV